MKIPKACIGDYLLQGDNAYNMFTEISENDGNLLYRLDSGEVLGHDDFDEDNVRLESEVID